MDATKYKLLHKLGVGSFATVMKGQNTETLEEVAIKILHLETVKDEIENIQKEISLLARLECPFVTKYMGSYLKGTDLFIVLEYMAGGSIRDLMKPGPLEEASIATIVREVLKGLVYLHGEKVVHRDIKAANILLSLKGDVKFADFGVSKELIEPKRFSVVGSPYWMAPEVISGAKTGYNEKVDLWSLGITCIEMAKGNPPRCDEPPSKVLLSIPKNEPPKMEGNFSKALKDFVAACLKKEPSERPTARDLLNHPFLKKARPTSSLVELIDRHKQWLLKNPQADNKTSDGSDSVSEASSMSEWDLDTIRVSKGTLSTSTSSISSINQSNDRVSAAPPDLTASRSSATPTTSGTPGGTPTKKTKDAPPTKAASTTLASNNTTEKVQFRFSDASKPPMLELLDESLTGSVIVHDHREEDPGTDSTEAFGSVIIRQSSPPVPRKKDEKKANGDSEAADSLANPRKQLAADKPPATPDKKDNTTNGTHTTSAASAASSSLPPLGGTPKKESGKATSSTPARAPSGSVKDKDSIKLPGDSTRQRRKSAGNPRRTRETISSDKSATAGPSTISSATAALAGGEAVVSTPSKSKRRRTEKLNAPSALPVNTPAQADLLNSILIPALTKEQTKHDKLKDTFGRVISDLTLIENKAPGVIQEIVLSILHRFEKEQKNFSSLGVNITVSKPKEQFEQYSDVTKYLLARWSERMPKPTDKSKPQNYFI